MMQRITMAASHSSASVGSHDGRTRNLWTPSRLLALSLAACDNLFLILAYPLGVGSRLEAAALVLVFTLVEALGVYLLVAGIARSCRLAGSALSERLRTTIAESSGERLRILGVVTLYALYALNSFILQGTRSQVFRVDLAILAALGMGLLLLALARRRTESLLDRQLPAGNSWAMGILAAATLGAVVLSEPRAPVGLPPRPPRETPATGARLPRANVLLVVIDTLRADRLSALGYERKTTPVLDRLAEHSVVFSNARSNATRTTPAMASLMTGASPLRHGIVECRSILPGDLPTLAERLQAAGYATWGILGNINVGSAFRFTRGLDRVDEAFRGGATDARPLVDRAIGWIREKRSKPYFLWLHLIDPHAPYRPPREHLSQFRNDAFWSREPKTPLLGPDGRSLVADHARVPGAETLADYVAAYDGEARYADEEIGRLLSVLEASGERDETLVVVTSDHGESLGERQMYFLHGLTTYDETARIPLLFSHPRLSPAVDPRPVRILDIASTILSLVLGPPARFGDGSDLFSDAVESPAAQSPTLLVAGTPRFRGLAITDGRWKLHLIPRPWREADLLAAWKLRTWPGTHRRRPLRHRSYRLELYDVGSDPGESRDLAGRGLEAETRLFERMLAEIDHSDGRLIDPVRLRDLSAEEAQEMRSLGYL